MRGTLTVGETLRAVRARRGRGGEGLEGLDGEAVNAEELKKQRNGGEGAGAGTSKARRRDGVAPQLRRGRRSTTATAHCRSQHRRTPQHHGYGALPSPAKVGRRSTTLGHRGARCRTGIGVPRRVVCRFSACRVSPLLLQRSAVSPSPLLSPSLLSAFHGSQPFTALSASPASPWGRRTTRRRAARAGRP